MSDETVTNLRHRLMVMKEILNEEETEDDTKQRKKYERRKKKTCLDTIIDGSFMGLILVIYSFLEPNVKARSDVLRKMHQPGLFFTHVKNAAS